MIISLGSLSDAKKDGVVCGLVQTLMRILFSTFDPGLREVRTLKVAFRSRSGPFARPHPSSSHMNPFPSLVVKKDKWGVKANERPLYPPRGSSNSRTRVLGYRSYESHVRLAPTNYSGEVFWRRSKLR